MPEINQSITAHTINGNIVQNIGGVSLESLYHIPEIKNAKDRAVLQAATRAIPFMGRDSEMASLRAWLQEDGYAYRVYQAEGGMGKTRMLLELCHEQLKQTEPQWLVGFLKPDPDEKISKELFDKVVQHPSPVLLVVDYAEARQKKQIEQLAGVQNYANKPFKVVFLCRQCNDKEGWLKVFQDFTQNDDKAKQVHKLQPITGSREEFYRAVRIELGESNPHKAIPPQLKENVFANTLMLCILALADVKGADLNPLKDQNSVLKYAKQHEEKIIREVAAVHGKGLTGRERGLNVLDVMIAAVALGCDSKHLKSELMPYLAHLEVSHTSFDVNGMYTALLDLYDNDNRETVDPIQPDLLQEYWVQTLEKSEWEVVLQHLQPKNSSLNQGLDVFYRLASWQKDYSKATAYFEHVWQWDSVLLKLYLKCLDSEPTFARAVAQALATQGTEDDVNSLKAFEQQRANGELPEDDSKPSTADEKAQREERLKAWQPLGYHTNLNYLFRVMGEILLKSKNIDLEKFFDPNSTPDGSNEDVAQIFEVLAKAEQASILNNYGVHLANLGQREEALTATREAVEIRRTLAAENPKAFNPVLATSLNNLGAMYNALGQREEALIATREGLELYRTLAAENPRAFNPVLAASLNNLGIRYSELGQREEALTATREAVELRRTLATENPRAFNPVLAGSLNNLGNRYSEMGQREEALTITREAVDIHRTLAAENPRAFNPDLAMSLNNLGIRYNEMGQREDALKATREAVDIHRTLAAENPRAFNPVLAGSLNNLGDNYKALKQMQNALKPYQQAVELIQPFASALPEVFQQRLQWYVQDYVNACEVLDITPDAELAELATQPNPTIAQLIAQMLANIPPEQAEELAPFLEHIQQLAQSDPQALQELLQQLQDSQE